MSNRSVICAAVRTPIGRFQGGLASVRAPQLGALCVKAVLERADLDPAKVRVLQPLVGGAFGGKSEPFDLEFCVAKLAMVTGRPERCISLASWVPVADAPTTRTPPCPS